MHDFTPQQVLIVEDDLEIEASVRAILSDLGFAVSHEVSGRKGLHTALNNEFALVVLDLGLPELGGMEVCRVLRQHKPHQPILILTAETDEIKKVLGLELGADEFINKPFSVNEFRARVRALLRRILAVQEFADKARAQAEGKGHTYQHKDLAIDLANRAAAVSGKSLNLTPTEFDILSLLIRNPGTFFTRETILDQIWGGGGAVYEQNVRTHISHLRAKLDEAGAQAPYIETQRGAGYRLK